jgi:hypothetical protein
MGGRGDAQGPGQPERTAGSNRVRTADSTQEPVPDLAAPDRAADRIAPALAGMGFWHHAHSLVTPGHRLS